MNTYRKNALGQLKSTFKQFVEEYKNEISKQEAFDLAKEYEIEVWKEQIEDYKCNAENIGFNSKEGIKMCKTMINELSKIKTKDVLSK